MEVNESVAQRYWNYAASTLITWVLATVAAAHDTWFQGVDLDLGDGCNSGGGKCARHATAAAFQFTATLACSVGVILFALSAFAKGYGDGRLSPTRASNVSGPPPSFESVGASSKDLGTAGLWAFQVFLGMEILLFIVMTEIGKIDYPENEGLGHTFNASISAFAFGAFQSFVLRILREDGTCNGGPFSTTYPHLDVGRHFTIFNAYNAVIASTLLITWPFALEGAAGNEWGASPGDIVYGSPCNDDNGLEGPCSAFYAATVIQYLSTMVCSCAVVALLLTTTTKRPGKYFLPGDHQHLNLAYIGAWGLLAYAVLQMMVFAIATDLTNHSRGDTFVVAVMSTFVAIAQAISIFKLYPRCRSRNPIFAPFFDKVLQDGLTKKHYWQAAASSVITFFFSFIIPVDDGWLDRGRMSLQRGSKMWESCSSGCRTYAAAVDLQALATCSCALAFLLLLLSTVHLPRKPRKAVSLTSYHLGACGGFLLLGYAFLQFIVAILVANLRNKYYREVRLGPTFWLAFINLLVATVQGYVILRSVAVGTRDGGFLSFNYRGRKVHATTFHEPYWEAVEAGEGYTAFVVRHPKADTEFTAVRLPEEGVFFNRLSRQFQECWQKPDTVSSVSRIYQIHLKRSLEDKIANYHARKGNICVAYHGTRCHSTCAFFVKDKEGPCGRRTCSLCNICMKGFTLEKVGRTARSSNFALRYGDGRYFSRASGKAHDYTKTEITMGKRRHHAMLVCEVSLGIAFQAKTHNLSVPCPVPGFDSTEGLTQAQGGQLNYDEVVVYDDAAARPAYIISYTVEDKDG